MHSPATSDAVLRASDARARLLILPRLLSLLSFLTTALRLHHRRPLSAAPLRALSDGAARLWQLFPVPRDSDLFRGKPPAAPHRFNLALVRLRCLLRRPGQEVEDSARLGAFFNEEMGAQWPLPRWLCLQWAACAQASGEAGQAAPWCELMDSVVERISAVQPYGSKVRLACIQAQMALIMTTRSQKKTDQLSS